MRLLVQEGAGARGAHGVHGEVLDHQVAALLGHHDHLGVFAAHVDDGAGFGTEVMGAPALGNDFVDEGRAQNLRQDLASHAGGGGQAERRRREFGLQRFQEI